MNHPKLALCLAFCLFAGMAIAGEPGGQKDAGKQPRGFADVAYDFLTLDTKMPAGRYSVTTVGPTHLFIRNENDHNVAAEVFTSLDPGPAVDNKDARLIFIEREGKTYLVGIHNADGRQRVTGLYGETRKQDDIRREVPLAYE